ncbi:GNAT family N-acetyltransferase [Hoyosella rhizosphaerae]|nr:GNAT family N-acetyltransferase [Hoyosella rhizosphaerae]
MEVPSMPPTNHPLSLEEAEVYAEWFACLAEPTRVRLLHYVARSPDGIAVGQLAQLLSLGQPTVSHHIKKLADVGFLAVRKHGTATIVSVSPTCCTGIPHAAEAAMGILATGRCCIGEAPPNVLVRPMIDTDWAPVIDIYAQGIAARTATFETAVPDRSLLEQKWLPQHRWVAEIDNKIAGWATLSPTSTRSCYRGVTENSIYVDPVAQGKKIGSALMRKLVQHADTAGVWTIQTSIFPQNRASIALHQAVGFRTVGVRERIAELDGVWHDTVLMERRARAET